MGTHKIEAHKITKPIQLTATWFTALLLINTVFLAAAAKIDAPKWLAPTLVISAIVLVPVFLVCVFLMQTVFRKELQDDRYYSEWLKRQEELFKNFVPENDDLSSSDIILGDDVKCLEKKRIQSYKEKRGLFLVHSWRPSFSLGQVADIVIWLQQHGTGPLSNGEVEKVEYQLGAKFFKQPKVKINKSESFKLEVSAYSPMLCIACIYIRGEKEPLILERYVNFEEL